MQTARQPWFVASDACKCLELKDDAGTICRELDEQDKVTLSREEFMGRDSNRGIICSVDACDGLALSNVSKALADLDDDDKLKLTKGELDTLTSSDGIKCSVDSRVQSLNLVSESGLYDLIMQSRKPEAKAFKRWVTHEVIPSIRKTGGYSVAQTPVPSYMLESEEERAC